MRGDAGRVCECAGGISVGEGCVKVGGEGDDGAGGVPLKSNDTV